VLAQKRDKFELYKGPNVPERIRKCELAACSHVEIEVSPVILNDTKGKRMSTCK